jgi:hypothetical protein
MKGIEAQSPGLSSL